MLLAAGELKAIGKVVDVARQVQRLDPEAIAGDEQALGIALPDGEGEHAVELGQQVRADNPGLKATDMDLANDVLHETYLRVDRMEEPPNLAQPNAYLYRMALNIAADGARIPS